MAGQWFKITEGKLDLMTHTPHPADLIQPNLELIEELAQAMAAACSPTGDGSSPSDGTYAVAKMNAQEAILHKEIYLKIIEAGIEDGY